MICEGCGCVFCWDLADEGALAGYRKRYCSEKCSPSFKAYRRRARRQRRQAAGCASRDKKAYESRSRAVAEASIALRRSGITLYPYECSCGTWHLSSQMPEKKAQGEAIKAALFGRPAR